MGRCIPGCHFGCFSFYIIHQYQGSEVFLEVSDPEKKDFVSQLLDGKENDEELGSDLSNKKLYGFTVLLALGVLTGGFFWGRSADIIAQETGMGSSFMGMFFLAIATSLPELSTSISAMRIRQYDLAFSDIFGANIFDILLLFVIDNVNTDGLIMNEVQDFSVIGATIGIVLTTVFLIGILIKSRKRFGNFGLDSIAVVAIYIIGQVYIHIDIFSLRKKQVLSRCLSIFSPTNSPTVFIIFKLQIF